VRDQPLLDRLVQTRRRLGAFFVDGFFKSAASLGRLHPKARPEAHGVELVPDVAYRPGGARDHLLDVYRPMHREGPLPVVLYVHGGGFRLLSKDTHWVMGLAFARRGYLVFNINYRLAPEHPFPAAIDDVCAAYGWVAENAAQYGGDVGRLALAGESAGANLVTSLAVATSYARPEPWAKVAWDASARPRAVVAACGVLQVTDPERFRRRKAHLSPFVHDRIQEVYNAYIGSGRERGDDLDLADPLLVIERAAPERPLPPFYAPVGTRDPLLDDTRRLKAALDRHGVPCEASYYEGELHAFHAAVFRPNARRCWRETYAFLERHLGAS
jgi:acetyl esterase